MSKKDENLVIIDADSLIYIVAYKYENLQIRQLGISALDDFIIDILKQTRSKYYLGFFGAVKSTNFRYNIAKTKVYKGNRPEKPDYIKWWSPILKARMEDHWGFAPVAEMEADDACVIAANKYREKFNKVIIATPDKDLFQVPNMHFYDYKKASEVIYCNETISNRHLFIQLIMGDTTDNIQGCLGAGKKAAEDFYNEIDKTDIELLNEAYYIKEANKCYYTWYQKIVKDKLLKKLEKEYLIEYKKENNIKRFTGKIKSEALKDFNPSLDSILTDDQIEELFKEMLPLIKMVDTEKEGKKHNFTTPAPIKENVIDWEEIINYENELEEMQDFNDDINILEDL